MRKKLVVIFTAIVCFLAVVLAIPRAAHAVELAIESSGTPSTEGRQGKFVDVFVWDYDGFNPLIRIFDGSGKPLTCRMVNKRSAAARSDADQSLFFLPATVAPPFTFRVYKTRGYYDVCKTTINPLNLPILAEASYKPSRTTQPATPTRTMSPIPLPEDPTRFAGKKIFDLFNPTGGLGLLHIILAAALALSFLFFTLGAFKYMVSAGDAKKAEEARAHMTWAVIGLAIVAASFFIVQIVGGMFGVRITE